MLSVIYGQELTPDPYPMTRIPARDPYPRAAVSEPFREAHNFLVVCGKALRMRSVFIAVATLTAADEPISYFHQPPAPRLR